MNREPRLLQLAKAESLAILHDPLADDTSSVVLAERSSYSNIETRQGHALAVSLRHTRIVWAALVAVAVLLGITLVFRGGVVLETFDKASKTPEQQSALLDQYNSYSGNAAAAIGRPFEIFIGVMAQLIVLRFMASSLVQPQPSWRIGASALLLGAVVGFFVNNGFNALNVQLQETNVRRVIASSDLKIVSDDKTRNVSANKTTNVTRTLSEFQLQNPTANIVLRNLVLAREPKRQPVYSRSDSEQIRFSDDALGIGFPQREWMKDMMPVSLELERLRVVLNATDKHANDDVASVRLPMNASRAADLFLTSVLLSSSYNPWGKTSLWSDTYDTKGSQTSVTTDHCGPWLALCAFSRGASDMPVAIHTYAACANDDGSETLRSAPRGTFLYDFFIECPKTSNRSLVLVSASKRLVAESLQENVTANASGIYPSQGSAVATNLRKIYSVTVGRLGWKWQDLAAKYNADCELPGGCVGLDFDLATRSQRLIVGADSLPLSLLNGPYYQATFQEVYQHPLPIVRVVEPPAQRRDAVDGDFLLPHNAGNVTWDMARRPTGKDCEVVREDRTQLVLNNHLYMESTLQATYTAGMFFLFQNAVVKETLNQTQSLEFDGNVHRVAVRISIPRGNAILTYLGCVALAGGLLAAIVWSHFSRLLIRWRVSQPPHAIARAMLDDQAFPSLLLHRPVLDATRHRGSPVDAFAIESLVLRRRSEDKSVAV